jgi:hypothetical protein
MVDQINGCAINPIENRRTIASTVRDFLVRLHEALRNSRARRPVMHSVVLEGMPEVHLSHAPIAPREYIPWLWIYAPVVLKWLALALRHRSLTLPTVANPRIVSGGFCGESKASYLRQIGRENQSWVARWTTIRIRDAVPPAAKLREAERRMADANLAYPLIIKPDIGTCGYGVRRVRDPSELFTYLACFPPEQMAILQEYVPWNGEAGIFYVRDPGAKRGRIYSLALRYYPHVVGDGRSTLRELIKADTRASRRAKLHFDTFATRLNEVPKKDTIVRLATAASLRVGALYRDGSAYVTAALTDRLDQIARSMPEFYYGRFDIRFRTIDALMQGRDFLIVEINGAGAEAIHIWDPELTIRDAYRTLFEQHEILFDIAACNRARGIPPLSLRDLIALQWRESQLLRRYPPSN